VYNNSQIDVGFQIAKRDFEYGTDSEHKTCSAQNTDRQTGREEKIHTRHKLVETGKQIRNLRVGDRGYY